MREIGGGCGEAALAVTQKLQKWRPGKAKGKKVRVMYTLPITFKLSEKDKKKIKPDSN